MNNKHKAIIFIETYAHSVLRIGMSVVILWFGTQQFLDTATWTGYIPASIVSFSHLSTMTLVYINAIFECIFGLALLFGFQVRIAALLLSLHLFSIAFTLGYGQIAVRDFGLALATLVVFMNGSDSLSLQRKSSPGNLSQTPHNPS